MAEDTIYYFMFSSQQLRVRKETEKNINREYKPKEVRVGGKYKQYTERITDPKNASYPDASLVTSGKLSELVLR